MFTGSSRGFRLLLILLLGVGIMSAVTTDAATINLHAWVLFSLYQPDGVSPLADGSVVQIIGSNDDVMDPIDDAHAASTTGDDIVLGTVRASSLLGSAGTFFTANIYYETDEVNYMYIRFYNTTNEPVLGPVTWGQSDSISNANHYANGVLEMDFGGGFTANQTNNFIVIPEPNTLQMMMVWGWIFLGGGWLSVKKCASEASLEKGAES